MTKKFKTITLSAKNQKQLNKMKKKLIKKNLVEIIKVDTNEKTEICSEDDIFKITSKDKPKPIIESNLVPKNIIPIKTNISPLKFIEFNKFNKPQVKLSHFPPSPKYKHKIKPKSHNKPKPIHLNKKSEKTNNIPIKKKFKIPTPNTKEKYNVKTQIKTFNNKKLLNNFNNLTKNEIFYFLSKNNIKTTQKAPIELYKTLGMMLSINKNHKLNII